MTEGDDPAGPDSFEATVRPLLPKLRSFALRMVAHPDDAEELVQDALLKAHRGLDGYAARSSLSTWLFSILTRCCLDHLRKRRRWRWDAQHHARTDPSGPHDAVLEALAEPDSMYDAREHLAFCFSCVGRSLSPEEAAALLLREVFEFSNRDAAKICDVSESVLRHRLSAARHAMQDAYEGLCGLVAKTGVCHQCAGLRDAAPARNRGPEVPQLPADRDDRWRVRLDIVRDADVTDGRAAQLHRLMFRAVARVESR